MFAEGVSRGSLSRRWGGECLPDGAGGDDAGEHTPSTDELAERVALQMEEGHQPAEKDDAEDTKGAKHEFPKFHVMFPPPNTHKCAKWKGCTQAGLGTARVHQRGEWITRAVPNLGRSWRLRASRLRNWDEPNHYGLR